jgi:copper(I)-binding protein
VTFSSGILSPGGEGSAAGGSVSTGTLRTGPLVLGTGSTFSCEVDGPLVDRITVDGNLDLTGSTLNLIPLIRGFSEEFYIIASYSGNLTGFFNGPVTVPPNYSLQHNIAAKRIELVRQGGSTAYADWALAKGLSGDDALAGADPDHDGDSNLTEFAFAGPPLSGEAPGFRKTAIATVDGQKVFTLTVAVRSGAVFGVTPGLTASRDDRLIAVSSPVAGEGQIHEMKVADGMMSMAELEDGLVLPAGEAVALQPGGNHIMLMALKQPLAEGEQVSLTLTFEHAQPVGVRATVGQPPAAS